VVPLDKLRTIVHNYNMNEAKPIDVEHSNVFEKWLKKLKDPQARARINDRIRRLKKGNPGDSKSFGDIVEMRIDYAAGYRLYYKEFNKKIIVMLCGGDKTKQQEDIDKARKIAKVYEKEYKHEN